MEWDWNIGIILVMLLINVVGWAYTLGKSAQKAKSGDEIHKEQTRQIVVLQEDCQAMNVTLAVVSNKVEILEKAVSNGLTEKVAACNVSIARLEGEVARHIDKVTRHNVKQGEEND